MHKLGFNKKEVVNTLKHPKISYKSKEQDFLIYEAIKHENIYYFLLTFLPNLKVDALYVLYTDKNNISLLKQNMNLNQKLLGLYVYRNHQEFTKANLTNVDKAIYEIFLAEIIKIEKK